MWNDLHVEPEVANEDGKTNQMCELANKIQGHNFSHHRHGFRGTHVKTQAIVKGSMTVREDLPSRLSQGIFSQSGKTYPIAIRYANEPIFLQDDRAPGPRGCGMKVFDVGAPGPFLDPARDPGHLKLQVCYVGTRPAARPPPLLNFPAPSFLPLSWAYPSALQPVLLSKILTQLETLDISSCRSAALSRPLLLPTLLPPISPSLLRTLILGSF